MAERSRRRLSFPVQNEGEVCSVCHVKHSHTSSPKSWKNASAQQYAITSLGLDPECVVCRPCRDDILRVLRDPTITPRWKKMNAISPENCCVTDCNIQAFTISKSITADDLVSSGLDISNTQSPIYHGTMQTSLLLHL